MIGRSVDGRSLFISIVLRRCLDIPRSRSGSMRRRCRTLAFGYSLKDSSSAWQLITAQSIGKQKSKKVF